MSLSRMRANLLTASCLFALMGLTGCADDAAEASPEADVTAAAAPMDGTIHPDVWPALPPLPLDPAVEARVDDILARMTLEQKVGQIIQADTGSITVDEVREYRLGSVLSGGNSAPGGLPYASTDQWLDAADAYFDASLEVEGVEVAIPIIWGIDAVHGHANLRGAIVFPHNIGLGATRNPELIERIAEVTARELSVSGHDWTFAPTLAVPRDDRWGRTYEGFSEDPEIVASFGGAIARGLQGDPGTDSFMGDGRVISTAKHFVGDGGTFEGRDQGDALISEEELRDIHNAGYMTAIPAGSQSVMASFSSWQGIRMHGNEELLTDVLKGRMGFQGFVVGDWNGHGLIPGCTAEDCPDALNAGLDMFMAPDSWRGLYDSTLEHVRTGRVSEERLDDAVRRILRVKVASGVFEAARPSERPLAGDLSILGSGEHRAVARQAVRESLVLLKNNNNVLPIDPGMTVLVVGDGADSITKTAGGWTLSWQGGGYPNSEFPNGQSILGGIEDAVSAAGGTVIFDVDGSQNADADVVIAVYGEDPYAEFQGDRDNLDFLENGFDTDLLASYQERDIPVVSVFLSGRPLWTNPEINDSDAFIAAWLPGSEGGGVADLLFQSDPGFDFSGRLSFSWPRTAVQTDLNAGTDGYDPLFALGYGLTYADDVTVDALPETSGLDDDEAGLDGVFFTRGGAVPPWSLSVLSGDSAITVTTRPTTINGVTVAGADQFAQEDALLLEWETDSDIVALTTDEPIDLSRESNGALELAFDARGNGTDSVALRIGMGCAASDECAHFLPMTIRPGAWQEYRVSLSCFADHGVDMMSIDRVFAVGADAGRLVRIGNVRLETDTDGVITCGD